MYIVTKKRKQIYGTDFEICALFYSIQNRQQLKRKHGCSSESSAVTSSASLPPPGFPWIQVALRGQHFQNHRAFPDLAIFSFLY